MGNLENYISKPRLQSRLNVPLDYQGGAKCPKGNEKYQNRWESCLVNLSRSGSRHVIVIRLL